jgi:hypothetical protein
MTKLPTKVSALLAEIETHGGVKVLDTASIRARYTPEEIDLSGRRVGGAMALGAG